MKAEGLSPSHSRVSSESRSLDPPQEMPQVREMKGLQTDCVCVVCIECVLAVPVCWLTGFLLMSSCLASLFMRPGCHTSHSEPQHMNPLALITGALQQYTHTHTCTLYLREYPIRRILLLPFIRPSFSPEESRILHDQNRPNITFIDIFALVPKPF